MSICLPNGSSLDSTRSYTIVINDFMLAGGSGLDFNGSISASEALNWTDLDAFIAQLRAAPQPVQPPSDPRFVQGTSEPCRAASQ
jgi:hypothetical protein